jgi:2-C-methyl-D-erythritol 4-phosphate cytidylyltransferase/2-C-methyl-D-erythritol 2,4-cyclodiphosphate synthase
VTSLTEGAAARRVFAVVPAAGRGERFEAASAGNPAATNPAAPNPAATKPTAARALPKQYASLAGASVLEWSLRPLLGEPRIAGVVVVLGAGDAHGAALIASLNDQRLRTAVGGASRQESVMNGLRALDGQAAPDDWILVHDAARPCLSPGDVRALIDALAGGACGCGAVLAAPIFDTVKRERGGVVSETLDRAGLWRALTPQAFGFSRLKAALADAIRSGLTVTDEAQAIERMGDRPLLVKGSPFNIKVTHAEDLAAAAGILQFGETTVMSRKIRIGQGFDVHAFGDGEHVVLGGVRIAHHRGVVAHSDGDVVIHALCDAVLGALGEGDIGRHFPDSDPRYRGADSRVFLRQVAALMRAAGLRVVNADVTVMAEAPRIGPHRVAMAANLAADLEAPAECINIKATTTERLGFVGRGEGIAASAAVLLESRDS